MRRISDLPRSQYSKTNIAQSGSATKRSTNKKSLFFNSNGDLNHELKTIEDNEFQKITQKIFLKKAVKKLRSIIPYSEISENICQQWQNEVIEQEGVSSWKQYQSFQQILQKQLSVLPIIIVSEGITTLLFIWMSSIRTIFRISINIPLVLVTILIQILLVLCQLYIFQTSKDFQKFSYQTKLKKTYKFCFTILGTFCLLIDSSISLNAINIILEITTLFLCFFASNQNIRVKQQENQTTKNYLTFLYVIYAGSYICNHYTNQGLIIYSSVYLSSDLSKTWLNTDKKNLLNQQWYVRYIYSVYWAITTTVTVGFGDLTPQNPAQVIIIMIIQVLGTSFFGYMINVIGITVDNINKKNEQHDNYQQTISKLKQHYKLSDQLCFQMKRDVQQKHINEQMTPIKQNQQIQFLQYLGSNIKKSFIHQTNIKVIKKSIFFLTYFTVNFQNQIALRLIRIIYKKDDKIQLKSQITNKKNMVIINNGKVNIYVQKYMRSSIKKKFVKNINTNTKQQKNSLNVYVYGYSGIILNQNLMLSAFAQQLTSGYILKQQDLLQIITLSEIDFQNFHQMRQKMISYRIKQSIEAPNLIANQFHYEPNIFLMINKYIKVSPQKRSKYNRSNKRIKLMMTNCLLKQIMSKQQRTQFLKIDTKQLSYAVQKKCFGQNQFQSILSIQGTFNSDKNLKDKIQNTKSQTLIIDNVKIFQNFMIRHNIDKIALKYEKACNLKSYKKRILTKFIKNIHFS